jgi:hypothetical protein
MKPEELCSGKYRKNILQSREVAKSETSRAFFYHFAGVEWVYVFTRKNYVNLEVESWQYGKKDCKPLSLFTPVYAKMDRRFLLI